MFGLLRTWKRNRIRKKPFPSEWLKILERDVPFFEDVPEHKRKEFLAQLQIFAREKTFLGQGGMQITDAVRVAISAAAVRLTLYLDISYYDRLTEILVYPTAYRHPKNEESVIFGEAHVWGTVILAWNAVTRGFGNAEDGHDTAIHEFAHVLDIADGSFDGTPILRKWGDYDDWNQTMEEYYLELRERAKKGQRKKVLRDYGAQNEAEFFAVATEAFFEKPTQMQRHAPELYKELQRFYGWDTATIEEQHKKKRRPSRRIVDPRDKKRRNKTNASSRKQRKKKRSSNK